MDEKKRVAGATPAKGAKPALKGGRLAESTGRGVAKADRRRFVFDISTSARWSGIAVGIVRVERELARRAAERWGSRLDYCVYDLRRNVFRKIGTDAAMAIIEGRLQLDFDSTPRPAVQANLALLVQLRAHLLRRPRLFALIQVLRGRRESLDGIRQLAAMSGAPTLSLRQIARQYSLRHPRFYQAVARLRGRSFSLAQIERLRADGIAAQAQEVPDVRVPLDHVSNVDVLLDKNLTIISGGLDWEYKDIRAIYKLKAEHSFRYAAIIYDLIPLKFPHYVVPFYVNSLTDYFGELFWTADYAMCISQCTQADVVEHCAENGIPPIPISHFPLGGDLPDNDVEARLPAGLQGKRYALFVSTIEPRKGHRTLYEAWDDAIQRGAVDSETCRLVFVGRPGWNTGELMHEIRANPRTKSSIIILEGISDAALNALYRGAEFGLFPSRYEGYGLPLAEMLSHGLPCISSPAGSLPEVGQALVTYKDPIDIKGWSEAIADLFSKPALLSKQRRAIRAEYKPTSWNEAARVFFDRLDALVQQ
jgi:glycosyltransferase involved in cell wall biosynthesis